MLHVLYSVAHLLQGNTINNYVYNIRNDERVVNLVGNKKLYLFITKEKNNC